MAQTQRLISIYAHPVAPACDIQHSGEKFTVDVLKRFDWPGFLLMPPYPLGWLRTSFQRTQIVLHTRNDGQEALLRYVDTRIEEWVLWDDFQKEGKWHRNVGER